eukprot:Hpha_TRINITY_DN16044_c0_g1::TRINITY_DN16044_c0_g1_i5::g.120145::m.120145
MKRLACILVLLLCAASGQGDHDHEGDNDHHEGDHEADHHEEGHEGDHGHEGENDYEWAGTFDVSSHGIFTWTAQASEEDGTYPDAAMKIVIIQGNSDFSLESGSVRTHGGEGMAEDNEPCTNVTAGLTIPISTGDPPACYNLVFDQSLNTSVFRIDTTVGSSDGITTKQIPKVNSIAIFAQHLPIEFERDLHYIKGVDGSDLEPIDEYPEPAASGHGDHDHGGDNDHHEGDHEADHHEEGHEGDHEEGHEGDHEEGHEGDHEEDHEGDHGHHDHHGHEGEFDYEWAGT